ncbi:MAG: hypothetical protein UR26_C0002G0184 [candidate division TM6 bacterium GW2011_GWF2_32_72]|nr:MAG: hypothetical protein UR26_C0002G0184 [candidate division TM6 bacterium GW2011_GWF2_32_72]
MKIFSPFVKKILAGLLIGIAIVLAVLQEDPHFKRLAGRKFKQILSELFDCNVEFNLEKINLFMGKAELTNLKVFPKEGSLQDWQWNSNKFDIYFSLIRWMVTGKIALKIFADKINAESAFNDLNLDLISHINCIVGGAATDFPVFVKAFCVKKWNVVLIDSINNLKINSIWTSEAKIMKNLFKWKVCILDCSCEHLGKNLFKNFFGHLNMNFSSVGMVTADCECSLELSRFQKGDELCYLSGEYKNGEGVFTLRNNENTFKVSPIKIYSGKNGFCLDLSLRTFVANLLSMLPFNIETNRVKGSCCFDFKGDVSNLDGVEGAAKFEGLSYDKISLDLLETNFKTCSFKDFCGDLIVQKKDMLFSGTWQWDDKKSLGRLDVLNLTTLNLFEGGLWSIAPNNFILKSSFDKKMCCFCDYSLQIDNEKMDIHLPLEGGLKLSPSSIKLIGNVAKRKFGIDIGLGNQIILKSAFFNDIVDKKIFTISSVDQKTNKFVSELDYKAFKFVMSVLLGFDLQGDGKFVFTGVLDNKFVLKGDFKSEGNLRFPGTYNFIEKIEGHFEFDFINKKLVFADVLCKLYRGDITINRATILLDDAMNVKFIHAPLIFQRCFLNWRQDLISVSSGRLLLQYDGQRAELFGNVILDRTQIKENVFSKEFQKDLLEGFAGRGSSSMIDINLDFSVESRHNVSIKTSFLNTDAKAVLKVSGTSSNPEVSGSIELFEGEFKFPYRPLNIVTGKIFFLPHQPLDPILELVARNKVKKYNVTMRVEGSLSNPLINFETSPFLTEEQTISLLLAGSEESSLSIIMPTLLMQNLKNVLFGPAQSVSKLDKYFKSLFRPLRNVHIIPSFNDQSGRGGLRGTIEIEASERLHALIQKNFSLTEDTRLEVEYLLSDEMSLRAMKDERGDLGAEVEMRWKF